MTEIWEIPTFTDWENEKEPTEETEERVASEIGEPRKDGTWRKIEGNVSR